MQYTIQTLVNALSLGGLYSIVALGVALIFSVMRLVNFAHGAIIMVVAYVIWALSSLAWPVWVLAAVGVGAAVAIVMERVAFRPVRGADMTTLLIASFAVNTIMQDAAQIWTAGITNSVPLPVFFVQSVDIGGYQIGNLSLITLAVTSLVLIALAVFFRRTRTGIQMRAAAEDFLTARLLGVRANRVISWAFGISGMLAGLAGILLLAQSGTVTASFGFQAVVVAFIATVIGGMGSLPGSVVGGFVLGITSTALQAWLPATLVGYGDTFVYLGVIAILLLRPQGILGKVERGA